MLANLLPILALKGILITLGIILAVIIVIVIVLAIVGNKMQKKNDAAMAEMKAAAKPTSILVIDKKRLPLRDAGFPSIVVEQTPKFARRAKVPVVKAKIGPQVATLMCDEKVYDLIPVKKECKVMLSGIYIMSASGIRNPLQKDEKKKKGFFARFKKDKTEAAAPEKTKSSKKK